MNPIAIVTGGTSGIGLATANALRDSGAKVYVLSRKKAELKGLTHMVCDVSDESAVRETVNEILAREGRIDCRRLADRIFGSVDAHRVHRHALQIIKNHGYGVFQACQFIR